MLARKLLERALSFDHGSVRSARFAPLIKVRLRSLRDTEACRAPHDFVEARRAPQDFLNDTASKPVLSEAADAEHFVNGAAREQGL